MAREFKAVDRDTPMLLPPDLREWLPDDHLAYLVLAVVEQLDLSAITAATGVVVSVGRRSIRRW